MKQGWGWGERQTEKRIIPKHSNRLPFEESDKGTHTHTHTGVYICYQKSVCGVWLPTTQKPIKRPGWWKGKFALFQMLATGGGGHADVCSKTHSLHTSNQWGKGFYRQKEEASCRKQNSFLTVIFKLIIGGLTSVILVVLGTVNLQFQGLFVPISLRPVLKIVAACIMGMVVIMQLTSPPGVLVPIRQLRGCGSEDYLQPL